MGYETHNPPQGGTDLFVFDKSRHTLESPNKIDKERSLQRNVYLFNYESVSELSDSKDLNRDIQPERRNHETERLV